jgi:uncharacterized protein YndB with AHSA1/START domain
MRWILLVLAVLVGIAVAVWIVGVFLPREHTARMAIVLGAAPDRVWTIVSDVADTARWRTDVTRVEVQSSPGEPLRFTEHSKYGAIPFQVVSQTPPERQVVRVIDDDQPFGGTWTWELFPEGSGTRLTITENGFVRNPMFRVMRATFFSPTTSLDIYLRALAKALGEGAEPRVIAEGSR